MQLAGLRCQGHLSFTGLTHLNTLTPPGREHGAVAQGKPQVDRLGSNPESLCRLAALLTSFIELT